MSANTMELLMAGYCEYDELVPQAEIEVRALFIDHYTNQTDYEVCSTKQKMLHALMH